MKTLPAFTFSRRFAPLFGTQFLGAFNDNLFKTSLFVLISFYGLGQNTMLPSSQILNLGALLFVLPYFLFSALAGQMATRWDKAKLARYTKILEVGTMTLAAYGFFLQSAPLLLFCLFLMGAQSALFGPIKYAILPEYLHKNELVMGNGLIESGTFLAILFGQICGTLIAGSHAVILSIGVIGVAVFGLICSMRMPAAPVKNTQQNIERNFLRSTHTLMRQISQQPELWLIIIGISWFWFAGAIYTTQLPTFVKQYLNGNDHVFNLMLTLFSIGIASGSMVCAHISKGKLRHRLIIIGALGLSLCGGLLIFFSHGALSNGDPQNIIAFLSHIAAYPIIISMIGIGFFGGFFSVPLYTWLQMASSDEFRASAIAANNIMNAMFMVTAAIISSLLLWLFDSVLLLFACVAIGNIPVIIYLIQRSPAMRLKT